MVEIDEFKAYLISADDGSNIQHVAGNTRQPLLEPFRSASVDMYMREWPLAAEDVTSRQYQLSTSWTIYIPKYFSSKAE